jgi:hypothetical protein
MATVFWDRKGVLMVEFMQQGTTITWQVYCETLKKLRRVMGMLMPSGLVLPMTMRVRIQLLALEHCSSISAGSCLAILLRALISLRGAIAGLPTWRTAWDHSDSAVMSRWKVSKHGWARRRQTSLTPAYKNLFLDKTITSIPAVPMLRSSLSIYASPPPPPLLVLSTVHQRLDSE